MFNSNGKALNQRLLEQRSWRSHISPEGRWNSLSDPTAQGLHEIMAFSQGFDNFPSMSTSHLPEPSIAECLLGLQRHHQRELLFLSAQLQSVDSFQQPFRHHLPVNQLSADPFLKNFNAGVSCLGAVVDLRATQYESLDQVAARLGSAAPRNKYRDISWSREQVRLAKEHIRSQLRQQINTSTATKTPPSVNGTIVVGDRKLNITHLNNSIEKYNQEKAKKKKRKVKHDIASSKNKPKQPLSAYNYFFSDERQKMIKEASVVVRGKRTKPPIDLGFESMAKTIGARWKDIEGDAAKKRYYENLAKQDKERYESEMESFKKESK
jgi:HMG-box domain